MRIVRFPETRIMCELCQMTLFIEHKNGKTVASHPTTNWEPPCPNSHKAFEVPLIELDELPAEYFSDKIG